MNGLEIKSPDFTRVIENDSLWTDLLSNRNLPPFSDEAVAFVSALSTSILALEQIREQPELVALAFWLRRSNIQKMIADYNRDSKQNVYPLARGVVLHIAPSNVDTIFVYSWILSLLCGNRNILRVPSRSTPQINILLGCINGVLSKTEFREIRDRVSFLRYEASEDATSILSNQVDMRIIWGVDETVNRIRRIPIPPTALDISFANKWSLSVINYEHWVQLPPNQKLELARSFALDAFQFGQAACSSPRCVVWLNEIGRAHV